MNNRTFLSPSSQEHNLGAIPNYVEEAVCNQIADAAQTVLNRHPILSFRNNPAETYREHTERSNNLNVGSHIVIHSNGSSDPTITGLRVGCFEPDNPERPSTVLANIMFEALSPVLPSVNDKIVRYTFYEIEHTVAPCAYLELDFHTNPKMAKWIVEHTQEIGIAIALGILRFHDIPYQAPAPQPLYRVIAGTFRKRENAITMRDRLRASGFDAIVREE